MGSLGSSSVQVPRVPVAGIPKDASIIPVKVELLEMVVPKRYMRSIPNSPELYASPKAMPLLLDEKAKVGTMPAPRVVGPVIP